MVSGLLPVFIALLAGASDTSRVCLAPATVEASPGDATAAANAVRDIFTSFLTGPSLKPQQLAARLASQVREEARQASCPYLLLTTLKHEHKRRGGSMLGRVAAGAAQQGAWEATRSSGTAAVRVAGSAAYGAAGEAAYDYSHSVYDKDEVTLGYRLESGDGRVLIEKTDKRKAKSDGEDMLTPMVQQAAEAIAGAVTQPTR